MSSHSALINAELKKQQKKVALLPNTQFEPSVFFQSNKDILVKPKCNNEACAASYTFYPFQTIGNKEYIESVVKCLEDNFTDRFTLYTVVLEEHNIILNSNDPPTVVDNTIPQRFRITEHISGIRDNMII